MSLYERWFPIDPDGTIKIAHQPFVGMLGEYSRSNIEQADIIFEYSLDSDAQADLQQLVKQIDSCVVNELEWLLRGWRDVLRLAEAKQIYTTKELLYLRMGIS